MAGARATVDALTQIRLVANREIRDIADRALAYKDMQRRLAASESGMHVLFEEHAIHDQISVNETEYGGYPYQPGPSHSELKCHERV